MEKITCKSGEKGCRARLQEDYSDFSEYQKYDEIYGLSRRIGFETAREAWNSNPLVEWSTNPDDYRISPEEKTRVIFRTFKAGGDVLAIFPDSPWDRQGFYRESYQHIGQHGGCDASGCVKLTRLSTKEEYSDLKRELERIGYDLDIRKRLPAGS